MTTPWLLLTAIVLSISGYALGNYQGHDRGVAEAAAQQDKEAVAQLTKTVRATTEAIASSNQASKTMREILGKIEKSGRTTTQELKDALEKNKTDSVLCRFDTDSMRIITTSRELATERAANGIRGAVPGTTRNR